MFSIPILIPDEMPLHTRRRRHPCPTQHMHAPRSANFRGVFPDMMPSSMQPVWMFQPDAFSCSPSPRPCSQHDAFPCFTSLRNCGSSCAPQPDTSPSSPEERLAPQPKSEPSDFTQKVMSDLFGDILTTGKEDVVNKRKEQKSRKQKMSRRNARDCSKEKSRNQVLTDFLIDTLEGFCAPQSKKAQKWTHLVDCSGFKSENIYVKVLEGCIIVRGEKEEHGEDGSISVTSIEKRIQLPQNLHSEKVSCRLLPNSRLLIEAPYKKETKPQLESSSSCSEEDKSMSEDIRVLRETMSSKNVEGENSDEAKTILESENNKESSEEEHMLEDQESPMINADDFITESMMDQVDETPNKTDGLQGLQRMHSLTYCQPPAITMEEKEAADKHTSNADDFQVRLEMMCHRPESIRVTMDDATNTLNICASKDRGNGNHHDETTTTVVVKQVRVPDTVDVHHLTCQFQDGLLSITAPFKSQSVGGGARRDIPVCM